MPDEDQHGPVPSALTGRHPGLEHFRHALGGDDALPIDPDLEVDDPRAPGPLHHPHAAARARAKGRAVVAAVFVGGALGTAARDAVESAWSTPSGHFPNATFVVNTAGALLLGVVLTVLLERLPAIGHRLWRPFFCTGVLGGWTTYSSLVIEADTLAKGGHMVLGAGYVAITLVCGVVAAAVGIALGRVRVPVRTGAQ
jgi:CrcB protein